MNRRRQAQGINWKAQRGESKKRRDDVGEKEDSCVTYSCPEKGKGTGRTGLQRKI